MDRLARDAAARYGPSSGGGGGRPESFGRRGAVTSSRDDGGFRDLFSSGKRESRRASHSSSRRLERSPPRLEYRGGRSNKYGDASNLLDRQARARRERRERYDDQTPLSARAYADLRGRNRYSEVGLTSSISPYHDAERRPSTMASYREGRRQASVVQAQRASHHIGELSRYEEDNRRAAQRYVTQNYTRRGSTVPQRHLYPQEVPARYGGGDMLSSAAAERRRVNSSYWDNPFPSR